MKFRGAERITLEIYIGLHSLFVDVGSSSRHPDAGMPQSHHACKRECERSRIFGRSDALGMHGQSRVMKNRSETLRSREHFLVAGAVLWSKLTSCNKKKAVHPFWNVID